MALNRFMHPRNPYFNNLPDFKYLADNYSTELKSHLHYDKNNGKYVADFYDPNVLKALCCALLKHTFNLEIDIPIDHLIPRVPQRINYCLWIEDLLERKDECYGIDIGCGSSCIYALIACSLNKNWRMLVSDIDDTNIEFARKNVSNNKLDERIEIRKVDKNVLINGLLSENTEYDFLMCNPPFYKNYLELQGVTNTRNPDKRSEPNSVNTAAYSECIYDDGGEIGFVKKMVDDSMMTGKAVRVYTTMLGKKTSFKEIRKYLLYTKNIKNISESRFCQGNTMRWAIAWSFHDPKLKQFDYMNEPSKKDKNSQKPIVYEIPKDYFKANYDAKHIYDFIKNLFTSELNCEIESEDESKFEFIFKAFENTWSHQRRKRRMELNNNNNNSNKRKLDEESEKEVGSDLKRVKLNDDNKEIAKNCEPILNCKLCIKNLNHNIYLELICIHATTKDYIHQILQFMKNKFKNG